MISKFDHALYNKRKWLNNVYQPNEGLSSLLDIFALLFFQIYAHKTRQRIEHKKEQNMNEKEIAKCQLW